MDAEGISIRSHGLRPSSRPAPPEETRSPLPSLPVGGRHVPLAVLLELRGRWAQSNHRGWPYAVRRITAVMGILAFSTWRVCNLRHLNRLDARSSLMLPGWVWGDLSRIGGAAPLLAGADGEVAARAEESLWRTLHRGCSRWGLERRVRPVDLVFSAYPAVPLMDHAVWLAGGGRRYQTVSLEMAMNP